MNKKKLLVTGSGGLVGSEVVELLHNDFDQINKKVFTAKRCFKIIIINLNWRVFTKLD